MKRTATWAVCVAAAVTLLGGTGTAHAEPSPTLANEGNPNLVLEVHEEFGQHLVGLAAPTGEADQQWTYGFTSLRGQSWYTISNVNGECLQVSRGQFVTAACKLPWDPSVSQRFDISTVEDEAGESHVRIKHQGQCMAAVDGSLALAPCRKAPGEYWILPSS